MDKYIHTIHRIMGLFKVIYTTLGQLFMKYHFFNSPNNPMNGITTLKNKTSLQYETPPFLLSQCGNAQQNKTWFRGCLNRGRASSPLGVPTSPLQGESNAKGAWRIGSTSICCEIGFQQWDQDYVELCVCPAMYIQNIYLYMWYNIP